MYEDRPKIKLHLSRFDKNIEMAGYAFLIIMWALILYTFFKLPNIIPIHFDAAGKVNNYGRKETILFLPVLGTVIFFGLTELNKYPHVFNYLVPITIENAEQQYTLATRMLRYLKLAILILFTIIILATYLTAIGIVTGLGYWFLPFTFGLLLIPTIITLIKSHKAK